MGSRGHGLSYTCDARDVTLNFEAVEENRRFYSAPLYTWLEPATRFGVKSKVGFIAGVL